MDDQIGNHLVYYSQEQLEQGTQTIYQRWEHEGDWDISGEAYISPLYPWSSLRGEFQPVPVTVQSWEPNRLDIIGIGMDQAMWQKTWDGSHWLPNDDGWTSLGGQFQLVKPAAVSWAKDRLDIVGIGMNQAIWHKAWDGSQWWPSDDGWDSRGGQFQIIAPSIESWGANRLDVFGHGLDRAIWHQAWDGSQWL